MITSLEAARAEQLVMLNTVQINDNTIRLHGSIAHAAMMDECLPSPSKPYGIRRDIDVYLPGIGKLDLETKLSENGLSFPSPIDAGLCGLLLRDGNDTYVSKDGVSVNLRDADVLEEKVTYEIKDSDGVTISSFSAMGMLAVHSLEPNGLRVGNMINDRRLLAWFCRQDIVLPPSLQASIDEFHKAYKSAYPLGAFYNNLASVYIRTVPESLRQHLRTRTHRFMRDHAGRNTPYAT